MKKPIRIVPMLEAVKKLNGGILDDETKVAILFIFNSTREGLDKIPFEIVLWRCKIKCCKHTTRLRDYGIRPWFFHTRFGWINQIDNFFLCGGHTKAYKTRWNSDNEKTPLRKTGIGGNDTVKPEIIY